MDEDTAENRTDRMQSERERRCNAEVPAAASDAPEQIGILLFVRVRDASLHPTITACLRSIIAFQIRRAASYFASSGRMSSPCNPLANSTNSSSDADIAPLRRLNANAGGRVKDLRCLARSTEAFYAPSL